jgi:hypothetical protein
LAERLESRDLMSVNAWVDQRTLGDSNNDGSFNSSDLVQVFQSGLYETGEAASWEQGDWNDDGRFDSADITAAFREGPYGMAMTAIPDIRSDRQHIYSVAHEELPFGGEHGQRTLEWISPSNGLASVQGGVWDVNPPNEVADSWTVRHNGTVLSTGTLVANDSTERSPFSFAAGSGGASSIANIKVRAGDKLSITLGSADTDRLGVDVDVAFNPTGIPEYPIGQIPDHTSTPDEPVSFFVVSPNSLANALRMDVIEPGNGTIKFDPATGRFEYTPANGHDFDVTVEFAYAASGSSFTHQNAQVVTIHSAQPAPEHELLKPTQPLPNPESGDYISVSEVVTPQAKGFYFNAAEKSQTRTVTISGKTVVFEPTHANGLFERFVHVGGSTTNTDITQMTIIAETVVIGGRVRLPQADVTIYAKTLEFRDIPQANGQLDTTPLDWRIVPGKSSNGRKGETAGSIRLHVEHVHLPSDALAQAIPRFVLNGAKGQAAGAGAPGMNGVPTYEEFPDCEDRRGELLGVVFPVVDWPKQIEWIDTPLGIKVPVFVSVEASYVYKIERGQEITVCGSPEHMPTNGGDATPGGRPGNGGDGGQLVTGLGQLQSLVESRPGEPGEPAENQPGGAAGYPGEAHKIEITREYVSFPSPGRWQSRAHVREVRTAVAGKAWTAPRGIRGTAGTVNILPNPSDTAWLHPSAIQSMLNYVKDAYLNGHIESAHQGLSDLSTLLQAAQPFPVPFADRLNSLQAEIASLAYQASSRLDYFGNPQGWAPSLSFAANYQAYQSQIDNDIRTLFVSQLIERHASDRQLRIDTLRKALQQLDVNIEFATVAFNDAQRLLPELEVQLLNIERRTEVIQAELKALEARLEEQARKNLEPPFWKKALNVLGPVLQAVPVPVVSAIGTGITVANNVISELEDRDWTGASSAAKGFKDVVSSGALKKSREEMKAQLDLLKPPSKASKSELRQYAKDLAELGKKYAPAVKALMEGLKGKEIPADEIAKELERLKASDPRFADITNAVSELTSQKLIFVQQLSETQAKISEAFDRIATSYHASDAFTEELSSELDGLRPETVEAAKNMAHSARARLLSYEYLMAKAYEYEMVAPYPGDLQQNRLFDSVAKLVQTGPDPRWLDDPTNFASLGALFQEDLSVIADQVWTHLNTSAPRLTSTVMLHLSADQIGELNRNESLKLDLVSLGIVDPTWDDARILDVRIDNVQSTIVGTSTQVANVRLEIAQPERSVIQRDGHRYEFVHPENAAGAARWAADYDANSGRVTQAEISPRQLAAVAEMLDVDVTSIDPDLVARVYSSPGASSILELRTFTTVGPATRITLEHVTLAIHLDYQRPGAASAWLEVDVNGDIAPRINIMQTDLGGHSDGLGSLARQFRKGDAITVSAQPQYGQWQFVEWRDETGLAVGRSNEMALRMETNRHIEAVYALLGDANFDGLFDTSDLVTVFQAGEYEDAHSGNSSFAEGDWNGDGDFDSSDILVAFQTGRYGN